MLSLRDLHRRRLVTVCRDVNATSFASLYGSIFAFYLVNREALTPFHFSWEFAKPLIIELSALVDMEWGRCLTRVVASLIQYNFPRDGAHCIWFDRNNLASGWLPLYLAGMSLLDVLFNDLGSFFYKKRRLPHKTWHGQGVGENDPKFSFWYSQITLISQCMKSFMWILVKRRMNSEYK